MNLSTTRRGFAPAVAVASIALVLAACGSGDPVTSGNDPIETSEPTETSANGGGTTTPPPEDGPAELSGTIKVDGSSTVFPLTSVAAELFRQEHPDVRIPVGESGTGGGFEKFCVGETAISDASRPIDPEEAKICKKNDVTYDEFSIANDGITVVVNPAVDFVSCITTDELQKIWDKGSEVDSWNDVNPDWPDEEISLYGPGTDSGTFDFFTEAINGEEGISRTDYQSSENDNVIVQGVSGDENAMGYFGYSYYAENQDSLKALEVDGGEGCVAPAPETVQGGEYSPLGRQLFIYPSQAELQKPEVQAFVEFYIQNIDSVVEKAGFIPLNEQQKQELEQKFQQLTSG